MNLIEAESAKNQSNLPEERDNSWLGGIGKKLGDFFGKDRESAAASTQAQEYLKYATDAIAQKNYQQAIAYLNEAIEIDSNIALAYLNRGSCYLNLKQPQQALADYNRAIEIDSNFALAYFNRGQLYYFADKWHKAIADFSKTIQLEPNNYRAYVERATVRSKLEDLQGAIEDYDCALAINPHDFIAYFQRGNTYFELGNLSEAIASYTKASEENSAHPFIYFMRGEAYRELGETLAAYKDYEQAAMLFERQGDRENAKIAIEAATALATEIHTEDEDIDRELTLIYRPKYTEHETISDPSIADLERVIDELYQEAQYLIQEGVSRFTGHFILEDFEQRQPL